MESAEVMSRACTVAQLQTRGATVPGNLDGTVVRNKVPHHRLPKQQRQQGR